MRAPFNTGTRPGSQLAGIALALTAVIIWSGNFILSRGVISKIGPVSFAFYRWLLASLLIAPLAWTHFRTAFKDFLRHKWYLFAVALTGIAIFNTCVYIAGHHTSAINMALIGTTSSPVFATVMAVIFLKERLTFARFAGMLLCLSGILLLLSGGSLQQLAAFRFSRGDLWILAGAFAFAIYSVLVKRKPATLPPVAFLFVVFTLGTFLLLPFYLYESHYAPATDWSWSLGAAILYVALGASVIAFLCWNKAIQTLGATRTVLFGNLIPVFSTLEAVLLLHESITVIHIYSGLLVIAGIIIVNRWNKT